MGISESLQWWEDSQLRVLVLASLILQYFLAIAAPLRHRCTHPLFRFFTWLAYLGSDAVAIYALATLFNRYRKQQWTSTHRSSASLEAMWAPIMLMHLGGQDGITAFNIEDNELWRRHVLTAASQITVAVYVFCKSWSGERRLLHTAILIFIPGILKCLEKPWALKNASLSSLTGSTGSDGKDKDGNIKSLEEYVEAAMKIFQGHRYEDNRTHQQNMDEIYRLFVDIGYSYDSRLLELQDSWLRSPGLFHTALRFNLAVAFDRLYTKEKVSKGVRILFNCTDLKAWCGNVLRMVVSSLSFAAIGVFHKSHKEGYDGADIKVTYTLLCCNAALEFLIPIINTYVLFHGEFFDIHWPDKVSQYNLIGYLAGNRKHSWWSKLAALVGCKDSLDQLWQMKQCKSSQEIIKLVHDHLLDGWEHYIKDPATLSSFNDIRGQWTLEKECGLKRLFNESILVRHLTRPFEESVLMWHLATDFCFYSTGTGGDSSRRCRVMSNYMVHLLFLNPEMLLTGTRRTPFTAAYEDLNEMLNGEDQLSLDSKDVAEVIRKRMVEKDTRGTGLIHDAWELSQTLIAIGKEEEGDQKMWRVIQGVWVEMLCFSASRCRGYLHAKNLSKGGEFLTYVWMIQSWAGMETLAERMQRTKVPQYGDKVISNARNDDATHAGDDIV